MSHNIACRSWYLKDNAIVFSWKECTVLYMKKNKNSWEAFSIIELHYWALKKAAKFVQAIDSDTEDHVSLHIRMACEVSNAWTAGSQDINFNCRLKVKVDFQQYYWCGFTELMDQSIFIGNYYHWQHDYCAYNVLVIASVRFTSTFCGKTEQISGISVYLRFGVLKYNLSSWQAKRIQSSQSSQHLGLRGN